MQPDVVACGRHDQRGQAVFETVLFLPLFLLGLFGVIWAVQAAVQSERVESAVRYAGLVSQRANPYADYSLYSMYAQLNSQTFPQYTCVQPLVTPLSDAAPTYTSSSPLSPASGPFWSPIGPQPRCPTAGLIGIPAGTGLSQDVILSAQKPGITSQVAFPVQLQHTNGMSFSSSQADEYFFRPVGINTILACYPALNTQVNISLRYAADTSPATAPVALTGVIQPLSLTASSACTTL